MATTDGKDGQGATAPDPVVSGVGGTTPATSSVPRRRRRGRAAKEAPIAFRPRPGTRALLARKAGTRPISTEVERAVDAWLKREVPTADPALRALLADELAPIQSRLSDIAFQEAGVGRNLNQLTKFCNKYRELPINLRSELSLLGERHQAVLDELDSIRAWLRVVAGVTSQWPQR